MRPKQPDRFLNFKEVAELLGLAIKTVRNGECETNTIQRIKLGGRVLFSFNAVQNWMAAKARKAEQDQLRSEMVVIDLASEKRRRQRVVDRTMKTIINGGRYE